MVASHLLAVLEHVSRAVEDGQGLSERCREDLLASLLRARAELVGRLVRRARRVREELVLFEEEP